MKPRTTNRIALVLSILAGVCFILFHCLPMVELAPSVQFAIGGDPDNSVPSAVWRDIWELLRHPDELLEEPLLLAFIPAFVFVAAGSVAIPFIIGILSRSRVLWWIVLLTWFLSAVTICYEMIVAYELISEAVNGATRPGTGLFCLAFGLQAQILALFFVRRSSPALVENEIR